MKTINQIMLAAFFVSSLAASSLMAWESYPDQTDDGLDRIDSKEADAVYWKEGATLADYNRVRIDNVEVSFRQNWLRDQNRSHRTLSGRISSGDMDDIREALAELFLEVFTEELEEGGYVVVNENGDDVLLLQPSIVDLDVAAPDVSMSQPGRSRNYVTSAGEMTLNMDFRDSATNALIGRAIDRREDRSTGQITYSSRVTNTTEAKRMLRGWAKSLVKALDNAHESG